MAPRHSSPHILFDPAEGFGAGSRGTAVRRGKERSVNERHDRTPESNERFLNKDYISLERRDGLNVRQHRAVFKKGAGEEGKAEEEAGGEESGTC